MDFHFEVLTDPTKRVFEWLRHQTFLEKFYLAGGTAIALYFGHRQSQDLDFFSSDSFKPGVLMKQLAQFDAWRTVKRLPDTLVGDLERAKLSFFKIPDKPIRPFVQLNSLRIADRLDLALMKIMAISDRGTKRDFIDLHLLCHRFMPLPDLLLKLPEKYGRWSYNLTHIILSLGYFEDAEKDEPPLMFKPVAWEKIKAYFHKESERLIKAQIT